MRNKLLRFLSYVVVAMLATAITLQMTVKTGTGKLDRLENLIQERYIGEADGEAMEDAANFHDSNYMTFYRIENYRQYLNG